MKALSTLVLVLVLALFAQPPALVASSLTLVGVQAADPSQSQDGTADLTPSQDGEADPVLTRRLESFFQRRRVFAFLRGRGERIARLSRAQRIAVRQILVALREEMAEGRNFSLPRALERIRNQHEKPVDGPVITERPTPAPAPDPVDPRTVPSEYLNGLDIATAGRRLDLYLANRNSNSPMVGWGVVLAENAVKHRVPIELAMAMLCMESDYGSSSLAKRTNNPGNLRDRAGRYGSITGVTSGGFAIYTDLETGIGAYFRLMDNPDGPYRDRIDNGDIAGLIEIYAPPWDDNDQNNYLRTIESVSRAVRSALETPVA